MTVDTTQPPRSNSEEGEPYAENTPLTWLFGDVPKVKIIAALLSEHDRDINISDISRLSGVSRSTIYDHIDELVQLNVVVKTREMGGSSLYQINTENEAVEAVSKLEATLLNQWCEGEIKQEQSDS